MFMTKYSSSMLRNSMAGPEPGRSPAAMAVGVLALCFAFNFVGRGVGDTYMVFLLPLEKEFGWHRSQMTAIYSTLMIVSGLAAPLGGMVFERWGPRVLYAGGLALLGIGYFLAGKVDALWQLALCIGVLGGLGIAAIGMVPAAALISRWFERRMSTAIGLAYAGFGCGSLLLVPLAQALIDAHGWRTAYQAIGAALLALLPIAAAHAVDDDPRRAAVARCSAAARARRRRPGARRARPAHLLAARAGDVLHRGRHVPDHRPVGRLPRRRRLRAAPGGGRVRRRRRALGARRLERRLAGRPLRPPARGDGQLRRHLPRHRDPVRDVALARATRCSPRTCCCSASARARAVR